MIPGLGRSPGEGIGYPLQYSWASLWLTAGKESACIAGDLGSIPGLGRSSGEGTDFVDHFDLVGHFEQCYHLNNTVVHSMSLFRCSWVPLLQVFYFLSAVFCNLGAEGIHLPV